MDTVLQLRYRVGLTQALLTRAAGINESTISRYERGLQSPTLAMLERLAFAVGLRPVITFEPIESKAPSLTKRQA